MNVCVHIHVTKYKSRLVCQIESTLKVLLLLGRHKIFNKTIQENIWWNGVPFWYSIIVPLTLFMTFSVAQHLQDTSFASLNRREVILSHGHQSTTVRYHWPLVYSVTSTVPESKLHDVYASGKCVDGAEITARNVGNRANVFHLLDIFDRGWLWEWI